MPNTAPPRVDRDTVLRLWFHRQGLSTPRGQQRLTRPRFSAHLLRTGGLQLDPISAVERAHYLTLWSRFGRFGRQTVDDWVYRDRVGYEYWGHEACILPIAHLPLGLRRMRGFPPKSWRDRPWWKTYATSTASKRRVLGRLRRDGPLESAAFESAGGEPRMGGAMPMPREDKRTLGLLWHDGRVAVATRRQLRRVYDLSERVYPPAAPCSPTAFEDSWLLRGLSGNGVASERHLTGYITGPTLDRVTRHQVLTRNLKTGRIVEVTVPGFRDPLYALPEHLAELARLPEPTGTTLLCPFDSFLWQRKRAQDLLAFEYRLEIYVPPAKRQFGYYALPILHEGALVGRVDPKRHRDRDELEVLALQLEPGVKRTKGLTRGLGEALRSLAEFVGASRLTLPRGWRTLA